MSVWSSFGIDQYVGVFGFGSGFSSTNFNVKRIVDDNDLEVISQDRYNLQLRLIWQIQKSDQVSLELRPYYQFSLGEYDLSEFAVELDNSTASDISGSPSFFGISLVFYNGRQ